MRGGSRTATRRSAEEFNDDARLDIISGLFEALRCHVKNIEDQMRARALGEEAPDVSEDAKMLTAAGKALESVLNAQRKVGSSEEKPRDIDTIRADLAERLKQLARDDAAGASKASTT